MANSSSDIKEYLVEGAKLCCVNGSEITQLAVPSGHGYTSGGKKKANCKDCKQSENIPYFGKCRKNEETHQCEGFMELMDHWEETAVSSTKAEDVSGELAISMSSVLICKKGGIIIPVTSGQGYDEKIDWKDFLKRYTNVLRWAAGKNLRCHVYEKDPINLNTGNYIYETKDLVIKGSVPLNFHLFYNAMGGGDQEVLGKGWSHNFGIRLVKIAGDHLVGIVLGDGREISYRRHLKNEYTSVMGDGGSLAKTTGGYCFGHEDGTIYEFDEDGKLLRQNGRNKKSYTFAYNQDGLLESVSNGHGKLVYTYNEEKKLIFVEDHTGRKVSLVYQYGKLRWFTNSSGSTYTYEYNENGIMDGVVTPRGILGVKNEYDGADRVRKQTLPDGSVAEFRYDDKNNCTYTKEQNGNLITYECDERMRNIRTIYTDGEETFAYNDRNQKIRYTDKNGNTTRYAYDSRGNLTQVVDALGQKINATFDSQGNLISIKGKNGACTKRHFDRNGNLVEIIDPNETVTRLSYDDDNRLKNICYSDGSNSCITYDQHGNVTSVTDPVGNRTKYEYDALNRVTGVTDGNDNITKYCYNERNDISKTINPFGYKKIYEYNQSGKCTAIIDYDGSVTRMTYNSCNRPEQHEDQEGNITQYQYDEMGNPICIILPDGGKVLLAYDKFNRLIQHKDATGGRTQFTYDSCGNKVKIKHATGGTTHTRYDELNRPIEVTNPQGATFKYTYDLNGNITQITDSLGNWKRMEYDIFGRKIKETDNHGSISTFTYNSMGKLLTVKNKAGRRTFYEYYPGGMLKKVSHPDGRKEHFAYDGNRNVREKWDEGGYRLFYSYDPDNRITSIKSSDGQKKTYTYDAVGNITAITDANSNTKTYSYSPAGNLTSVTDEDGNLTKYGYDCLGNVTAIFRTANWMERELELKEAIEQNETNHNFHITLYDRNLADRILSVINPLGHKEQYEFDTAGQVIKKTDQEGYDTLFTYTLGGQVESVTYDNGDRAEYTYGPLGELREVKDWLGKTTAEYDSCGRIQKVTEHRGKSIAYEFGDAGERKTIIYPDGSRTKYGYDDLLRLKEVQNGRSRVSYQYDKSGRLSERTSNSGLSTCWNYDHAGRLTQLIHKQDNIVLEDYGYSYDAMENRTGIKRYRKGMMAESGDYHYSYGPNGNLSLVEKDGQVLREYTYDSFGNRISLLEGSVKTEYRYNAADQLVEKAGQDNYGYQYDLRGNLIEAQCGDMIEEYHYNAMGRLAEVVSSTGKKNQYNYNGLGARTEVIENTHAESSIRTNYYFDMTKTHHNLLASETNTGTNQSYVWGHFLEGMNQDRTESFALLDEMGSPIRFLWRNGAELDHYGYDEFGCDLYGNVGKKQPFGYTGYRYDKVGGSYFAEAREYLPEMGRFAGEDIVKGYIENPVSLNSYSYCFNSPLNFVDFSGEYPEWLEIILEGTDAHRTLAEHVEPIPNMYSNVTLKFGLDKESSPTYWTKSGRGYIDHVYDNINTIKILDKEYKQAEVYELKKDTTFWHVAGPIQMLAYVTGLNITKQYGKDYVALPGHSQTDTFNCVLTSSKSGKTFMYHTGEPGMIYWTTPELEKKKQEQEQEALAHNEVPIIEYEPEPGVEMLPWYELMPFTLGGIVGFKVVGTALTAEGLAALLELIFGGGGVVCPTG